MWNEIYPASLPQPALNFRQKSPPVRFACFSLGVVLLLGGLVRAQQPSASFTEFSAPGAGSASGQGTLPVSINKSGVIAGFLYDSVGGLHGFVRSAGGTITVYDAPGAGTGGSAGTAGGQINDSGVIAGDYDDSKFVSHGYVRPPSGTIATFSIAGSGSGGGQGTFCCGMNSSGTKSGYYVDKSGVSHAFMRSAKGSSRFITSRAQAPRRAREQEAARSMTLVRSLDYTSTRTTCRTVMCAAPRELSPSSTFRARAPRRTKPPVRPTLTVWVPSSESL